MNELPQTEDWLDTRLRDAAPYIDDAGFTVVVPFVPNAPSSSSRPQSSQL